MKPLPLDNLNRIFGTKHKKADPKAERKKQMRRRKTDGKRMALVFCVVLAVLAAVSAATVISERKETPSEAADAVKTAAAEVFDSASEGVFSEEPLPLNANLLLALTEDGNSGLELLCVVSIDSETEKIRVSFVPVSTSQRVNNLSGTMKEHIENGGIRELLLAVEQYAGAVIDRYVCLDEADFADLMKEVGELEVNIEEEINHEYNGINFIIDEGTHSFAPDATLRYLVYLCQTLASDGKPITDIMAGITERLIADETGEKITSESYDAVINFVDTDISAMDIVNYAQAIAKLFDSGILRKVEIEPDIGFLKAE